MNAVVLCVGRLKEPWQRAGVEEYLKRLSRYGKYSVEQVDDAPDSLGARALEKEGEALLKRIRPGDHVVALCVEAEAPDSPGLAQCLRRWAALGSRTVLVIGGSNGLSAAVLARADEKALLFPPHLPAWADARHPARTALPRRAHTGRRAVPQIGNRAGGERRPSRKRPLAGRKTQRGMPYGDGKRGA